MNKLIVIGYMSSKRAYLNINREEAIRRYKASDGVGDEFDAELLLRPDLIEEIEFEDEFCVYDAWE